MKNTPTKAAKFYTTHRQWIDGKCRIWGYIEGDSVERMVGNTLDSIDPAHVERYKFASKFVEGKSVLDCACGVGFGANIMSEVASNVFGIDNDEKTIDYAREHWSNINIDFVVFDFVTDNCENLGTFDVVVSFETIEHLSIPMAETVEKLCKLSNGLLILSHPEKQDKPDDQWINPYHTHRCIVGTDVNEYVRDNGFTIIKEWYQPGIYHVIVASRIKEYAHLGYAGSKGE